MEDTMGWIQDREGRWHRVAGGGISLTRPRPTTGERHGGRHSGPTWAAKPLPTKGPEAPAAETPGLRSGETEQQLWDRVGNDAFCEWVDAGRPTENLIVSRHAGAVEWLRMRGITGPVVTHATPEDVRGRDVVGNLPLALAAEALTVTTIDLPDLPPEQRGKDLSPEEMDAAGACLATYQVARVVRDA